jgi:peroxiredoxin
VRPELAKLSLDYSRKSVDIVAITANDPAQYPDDAPKSTAAMVRTAGFTFPFLFDETQSVAKAYTVACAPD